MQEIGLKCPLSMFQAVCIFTEGTTAAGIAPSDQRHAWK
jgi:hypothetical protein